MTAAARVPVAPQPLLITANGHACLAWWHAPAAAVDPHAAPTLPRGWLSGGALPLAVVIANSWGAEDMSGYDGLHALAQELAAGGLGTLRFEWPDTGDSSADGPETTLADALAAFDAAAAQARLLSGCERLAFVGVRLGALLAAHAAAGRRDVDSLVALLPVASGRAFVREQRMLGATLPPPVPAAGESFDPAQLPLMLGGFTRTVRQAEALSALKWPAATDVAWREALVLSPAEDPAARAASDALARGGVPVREWTHHGLADLLAVAHDAVLPLAAIAETLRWLQARAADAPSADAMRRLEAATGAVVALAAIDAAAGMTLRVDGTPVRERIVRIEPRAGDAAGAAALVATLSERADDVPPAPGRRAVVLLSSGRERRVGPHRLWVPWARRRAALGDVVLRLDVAGIGDSARRTLRDPDGTPELYDARCVDDVARAAAWLRREHGVGHCTVMGVCSGAFHAWRAALAGVDVQQVVPINPLTFHWRKGMSLDPRSQAFGQIAIAANAGRSLLDPQRWWKLLSGRANVGVITGAIAARLRHSVRLKGRDIARSLGWRLVDDLAAELAQATARGVAVTFVFSRGEPGLKLLREESGRRGLRLINDSLVKVCEVEHADHTFAGVPGRLDLYARLDSLLLTPPVKTSVTAPAPSHRPALRRS